MNKESPFYDLRNAAIFEAMVEMRQAFKPIDLITLQQHLKDKGMLDQIGGIPYLVELDVPSAANLSYYLEIVCEKFLLRRALSLATSFANGIYEQSGNASDMVDKFERDVLALRKNLGGETAPIREVVKDALADIEASFQRQGEISGLSTGFRDLDQETDGLHPGEYILIGAFPSVGKTSLAVNIVEHIALVLKMPVLIFSAEMSARSLVKRSIASIGRVNMRDIRQGRMTTEDFPKILSAAKQISASNILIDDTCDMTIQQLRARARRMKQRHDIKLIIADYAQLFSSPGAENRTNEIDQVSKGFKNMAKELDVPVIVLSQLTEDQKGGVHLKGARALGEDADGYWHLKRPKGAVDDPAALVEPVELWLRKQRNEARGKCINLTFLKTFTRFESASKVYDAEPDYRNPND